MKSFVLLFFSLLLFNAQAQKSTKPVKSTKVKTSIIGNYVTQSLETRVIGTEENFGMIFIPNTTDGKNIKINTIILNLKKMMYSADLIFSLYEINPNNGSPTPDLNRKITSFECKISPNPNKAITEINTTPYNVTLPEKGVFISIYTKAVYDKNMSPITSITLNELPRLYFHKTHNKNFFIIQTPQNIQSTDSEKGMHFLQATPFEPSMAIKVD